MTCIQTSVLTAISLFVCSASLAATEEIESSLIEQEISRAISDPDSTTTIEVKQPISLVFDALLTRLADYSEDIASVDFDNSSALTPGSIGIGSKRITTMRDGNTLVQRIVLFEPPLRFAYFTDMALSTVSVPIDYSIGYYTLSQQAEDRVEATVSAAYKPSSRLTAFLVRIGFDRALARDFGKAEEYLNSLDVQQTE